MIAAVTSAACVFVASVLTCSILYYYVVKESTS
jgi:hypothetical protein